MDRSGRSWYVEACWEHAPQLSRLSASDARSQSNSQATAWPAWSTVALRREVPNLVTNDPE